ncbi:MAG: acyltransferase [Gemmatimonadota bacterium]|nr:acyltransferase [Gemmatimonadota bacterium]
MTGRDGAPATRIPALDGLRAVSIVLVLLHHVQGTPGAPTALGPLARALDAGNLGVRVFFVISGFLITGLLVRELQASGTIALRRFYYRRTLRIFPPAYVFLAVLALLTAAGMTQLRSWDIVAGLTYTMNFYLGEWTPRQWPVGHLWSLAVEEQFYLVWPAVLLWLGVRRGTALLVALALVVPVLRLAAVFGVLPAPLAAVSPFLLFADWLAIGGLMAMMLPRALQSARYRSLRASGWWTVALAASALAAWTAFGHWRVRELTLIWTIVAVAFIVDQTTMEAPPRPIRLLAWAPVVWVGRLSYSLYLWQQLFFDRYSGHWWTAFPLNVVLAFAAAAASYYGVERPILAWRDRARHATAA